jgi:pescadillo
LGRGEVKDAARLEKTHTPRITLDHIIKERYPTFVDALRDLDDALSMLFLFANLPSTSAVPPKTIALCQRLCHEFQHYLITTHSLRKSFLSIKGIYYQASIQGQDILWLVPYKFVQRTDGDIDFRIMGTFIEFYTTLLGFVNYRLYTSIGLVYPPKFDEASDEKGGELGAFTLEGRGIGSTQTDANGKPSQANGEAPKAITSAAAQAEADRLAAETATEEKTEDAGPADAEESNEAIDKFETAAEGGDVLLQPQVSSSEAGSLFAPFTFFLSRETPRQSLEFLLKAFGCKRVGWDAVMGDGAFTNNEADPSITHQIVDRPALPTGALPEDSKPAQEGAVSGRLRPGTRVAGRTYIQPQWVWDCINAGKLLRPDLYAPGATLPPHLSPWVRAKRGAYDPTAPLEEQEREGEAEAAELDAEIEDAEEEDSDSDEEMQAIEAPTKRSKHDALLDQEGEVEAGEGMDVASADSDSESEEEAPKEEWGGLDSEEDDDEDDATKAERQHQRELEAEAAGLPFTKADAGSTPGKALKEKREQAKKKADKKRKDEEEELQRKMMMMSQKKRKLLQQMQYSNKKTEAEAEKLRGKRRKLERSKEKGGKA